MMGMEIFFREFVSIAGDDSLETRKRYRSKYWSANQAIFDPGKMPLEKKMQESFPFNGYILIAAFDQDTSINEIKPKPEGLFIDPAGVIAALYFGTQFPMAVRQARSILAPGSIGSPDKRNFFCPSLDTIGSQISIEIGELPSKNGELFILSGWPVLLFQIPG